MTLITWNENLSVKVAELDQQHQKLIGIINDLTDAIKQGKGNTVTGEIVRALIDYAKIHFETEEKYFRQLGYPQAADHMKEHEEFVRKVTGFETNPKENFSLSIQVLQFLGDWLIKHILGTDKAYSAFFNAKGLR